MFIASTLLPNGALGSLTAGDAFYLSPGHVPSATAGTEIVVISPQDQLELTEAAMRANIARMGAGAPSTPATS